MGLIRTLILARLLFPEDFGQIGIVMTIVTMLDCVTQFGFTQALIQRKGKDTGCLDTAWTVSLFRSVALFLIVLGMAPAAAAFFRIDELTALMRVPNGVLARYPTCEGLMVDAVVEAVAVARRLAPSRTLFTHLTHELDHRSTNARLPAGMALAYDGLTIDLD